MYPLQSYLRVVTLRLGDRLTLFDVMQKRELIFIAFAGAVSLYWLCNIAPKQQSKFVTPDISFVGFKATQQRGVDFTVTTFENGISQSSPNWCRIGIYVGDHPNLMQRNAGRNDTVVVANRSVARKTYLGLDDKSRPYQLQESVLSIPKPPVCSYVHVWVYSDPAAENRNVWNRLKKLQFIPLEDFE